MFYSIKEVSEKLGKSEDEIRELVKAGRLREFRDGPNLLFKVDEVTSLMSDSGVMASREEADSTSSPQAETPAEPVLEEEPAEELTPTPETETPVEPTLEAEPQVETSAEPVLEEEPAEEPTPAPEAEIPVEPTLEAEPQAEAPAEPALETPAPAGDTDTQAPQTEAEAEEILLAPETPDKSGGEIQLTDADTQIVDEGIKVLGDSDTAGALGGDTGGETFKGLTGTPAAGKEASLEEIEKDVSLDTFGSGSGLLDLSLQADDTSLGGILDEIYTTPGGEAPAAEAPAAGGGSASALEVAAEADQILAEGQFPEMAAAPAVGAPLAYAEPTPDAMSNAMGVMLFLPLIAVIYTAIVAVAGFSNMMPTILKTAQGYIWYITGGLIVVSLLIAGVGSTMGGEKKPRAPKVKKQKPPKVKKEKPPKPKKEKKGKK